MQSTGLKSAEIYKIVCAKKEELSHFIKLNRWRTIPGTFSMDHSIAHAASWEEVEIPFRWSPSLDSRTFYQRLHVPVEYKSLSLIGSEVQLEFNMPIGAEIYVNDKCIYSSDYWAETQVVPFQLTESLQRHEIYDFLIHCKRGDGFGNLQFSGIRITAIDEWMFKLDTFAEEVAFVQFMLENGDVAGDGNGDIFETALNQFDFMAFSANKWDDMELSIERIRKDLTLFQKAAKQYKVYLAGHAHIDMNWLWPWTETVDLVRRDFESMDGIMNEYPEVCFSHSQAATYQIVQERFPELWERVKIHVKEGRWDVTASTWVEGDLNTAGYETMVRQFLEGKTYIREQLGVEPMVCWEPDTFGHPATMPQLLKLAGVRYYYHMRASKGEPIYWWEGPDGSRVLVFNDPCGYNGKILASNIMPTSKEFNRRYGLKFNMYVYGIGDHGGGVTRRDVLRALRLNQSPVLPQFIFAKTVDFYKDLEQSGRTFPVIRSEMNTVFEGCYSSHGDIKKANRETEYALVQAETLSAMEAVLNGMNEENRNSHSLRSAWQRQCFNQFHDILCGCSIHRTYEEAVPAAQAIIKLANQKSVEMMEAMRLSQIKPTDPAQAGFSAQTSNKTITVFNSLSFIRSDIVSLQDFENSSIAEWCTGDLILDDQGDSAVIQRVEGGIIFFAQDVPSFGFRTYSYQSAEKKGENQTVPIHKSERNNPLLYGLNYAIEIDKESGTIVEMTPFGENRQLTYTLQNRKIDYNQTKGLLNLMEISYEAPHSMSAWKVGTITRTERLVSNAKVELGEQGPVMQSVFVTHHFGSSTIRQEIRSYRKLDRIDFLTSIDWHETGDSQRDAPMLRVLFTPKLAATEHVFDVPFGVIKRVPDGREVPAIHWVGVSEGSGGSNLGLALLNNGKFGHSIQGNTLGMTLVRSAYEPDNRSGIGLQQFTYSLLLHRSSWQDAQVTRRAIELNQPLTAFIHQEVMGYKSRSWSALQVLEHSPEAGWLPSTHVIVTAFKNSVCDGDHWIVRLHETDGKRSWPLRLAASCPLGAVEEVNLIEEVIKPIVHSGKETEISLEELQPWEIRTIRLGLKGG